MLTGTVYRVISRNGNTMRVMQDAKRVADFIQARMQMGKGSRAYIVIKSDGRGDRVIILNKVNSSQFEQTIRAA